MFSLPAGSKSANNLAGKDLEKQACNNGVQRNKVKLPGFFAIVTASEGAFLYRSAFTIFLFLTRSRKMAD